MYEIVCDKTSLALIVYSCSRVKVLWLERPITFLTVVNNDYDGGSLRGSGLSAFRRFDDNKPHKPTAPQTNAGNRVVTTHTQTKILLF